jgi:hydrogenase nickel incorporation protein HypA/HybF
VHEQSFLRGLLTQIDALARQHRAARVSVVRIKIGPLAHIEPEHLREHFIEAAKGSVADGARLDIAVTDEWHDMTLESIDVEELTEK